MARIARAQSEDTLLTQIYMAHWTGWRCRHPLLGMALFVWLRKVISSSEFYVNNFTSMAAAPVHFALLDEVGPAIGTNTGELNVRFRMLKGPPAAIASGAELSWPLGSRSCA